MKIERIYITGCRTDLHLTRCCVASIRRWYPSIPIRLVKDELRGPYDTTELERYWDVERFPAARRRLGMDIGKIEVLVQPTGERVLLLDSDIVFLGRVLDTLDGLHEDVVVEIHGSAPADLARDYFDLAALTRLDPAFRFPGYTFNSGQLVATCGVLTPADFAGLVIDGDPPRFRYPGVFRAAGQGVLNYVLMKRHQEARLTLRRHDFMWWAGALPRGRVRLGRLDGASPYPYLVHWAGPKGPTLLGLRHAGLLRHFEREYYRRLPGGGRLRRQHALGRAAEAARGRWHGWDPPAGLGPPAGRALALGAWRWLAAGARRLRDERRGSAEEVFPPRGDEGVRALRLAQILRTPPIDTDPLPEPGDAPAPLAVHALCCAGDHTSTLWALKSFYHHSGERLPLVIHLQGPTPPDLTVRLHRHFPSARIVTQAEADGVVEPWLRRHGLRRLRRARRRLYLVMKLTDIRLLGRSRRALYIDSDVLFFRHPGEILDTSAPREWRFQRDCYDAYVLTPAEARTDLGVDLVPRLNGGLVAFPPDDLDPAECERYLAHPRLARLHYHTEQTLFALCASARGAARHLPASYRLDMEPCARPETLVARHYVSPVRPLLFEEGMTRLAAIGFLDALRRRVPAGPGT